jgi:hypothetical protein
VPHDLFRSAVQLHIGTLKGDNYSLWKDNINLLLEDYSLPAAPAGAAAAAAAAGAAAATWAQQGGQQARAQQQQQ